MTLRTRITLLTQAILVSSLLVLGVIVYVTLRSYLFSGIRPELEAALSQIESSLSDPDPLIRQEALTRISPNLYAQLVVVIGEPEAPGPETIISLLRSPNMGSHNFSVLTSGLYRVWRGETIYQRASISRDNLPSLNVQIVAKRLKAELLGGVRDLIVVVGRPLDSVNLVLSRWLQVYSVMAVLVLLLAALLAQRLVRRTLEPLEWVARKAEAVSQRPEALPEPEGRDEVAALIRSLNRMMARLEGTWQAQTQFVADASHELRTPITAILGHVNFLLRRTPLTEQQRESLEVIARESERMKKLVSDLLELSKSGSWKIQMGPVHVLTLLEQIQEDYARSFEGRIELEAPERLWVQGDPERLHQVLANLVSNAIKARATRVRLVARDVSAGVVIRVEDNGEGIPAEHLSNLFERFYRVDKARDRERGGTGLGLAIVKNIVEAHGGRVWVESTVGKGTTFSVSLMRATAPQPQLH
ncbi:sensor histidine kinase [Calidithermus roseus]|uniref:histidine kinase n=1 Tax=Calidithermus roseus TaxID=1644118 RepID=A0A399EK51_9DEIN|nr:HAMP domain-containing sensor histidine kinase [Calidithermus roseus]RIH83843.1 putative sensor histidine kinase TcrY [Calidithermus roseus]